MHSISSSMGLPRCIAVLVLLLILWREGDAATFTLVNRCGDTVWPGILSNAGTARLGTTGFELPPGAARAVPAPSGWSGRLWARTGCAPQTSGGGGRLVCATGDCGSGAAECAGAGAAPPATLAEFTLDGTGAGLDFYDVSLVDGYNLPVLVEPSSSGGTSAASCAAAGCAADLNAVCPGELRSAGGGACRSACEAFGRPEYCCSGAYASPGACRPTAYSQVFKMACPRSYSYAFDDPTSTFTCAGGPDYTITFCPGASPSQKSTTLPGTMPTVAPGSTTPVATLTPTTTTPTTMPGTTTTTMPGTTTPTMMPGTTFTDAIPDSTPMPMSGEVGDQGVILGESSDSWLANMATGEVTAAAGSLAAASLYLAAAAAPLALLVLPR